LIGFGRVKNFKKKKKIEIGGCVYFKNDYHCHTSHCHTMILPPFDSLSQGLSNGTKTTHRLLSAPIAMTFYCQHTFTEKKITKKSQKKKKSNASLTAHHCHPSHCHATKITPFDSP
jgi:hypothetical protein